MRFKRLWGEVFQLSQRIGNLMPASLYSVRLKGDMVEYLMDWAN